MKGRRTTQCELGFWRKKRGASTLFAFAFHSPQNCFYHSNITVYHSVKNKARLDV
jgi:hypothetical protein